MGENKLVPSSGPGREAVRIPSVPTMPDTLVYKPASERFLPERMAALQELVDDVARAGFPVVTEYHEQTPGSYGVTWWEVVFIYVGTRGLDSLVTHAFDESIDKLADVVKTWARLRFNKKLKNYPNPRPEFFAILDDDGNVLRAWKIDARGESDETATTLPRPLPPRQDASPETTEDKV